MGGLFHLFDFNQGSMARKFLAHKRHSDGLEAPRNSLELQIDTSQSCCAARDEVVVEDWSENYCYPIEASMKSLIKEEMTKQSNTRKNSPSIVARLMGVDMLPLETKPVVQTVDKRNGSTMSKHSRRERKETSSVSKLNSSKQMEFDCLYSEKERDDEGWSYGQKLGKPRPREHPQEEELQKFKKEFEAWQAARFKECSKVGVLGGNPDLLAQENVNKRKTAGDANFRRSTSEKPVEYKARSHGRTSLYHGHRLDLFPDEHEEPFSSRKKLTGRHYEQSLISCHQKLDKSSVPTKIVILKPGPDRFCDYEDSWTSSSGTLEDRGSIEDFLEEVKERLKCELQGKTLKRGSVIRGSGIETPFSERPSDPKQIARHIAKHVRDTVTRDLGMNLLRSESTRSYRNEIQFDDPGSPEFINRDTRRFLSERLRNVVKNETHSLDVPLVAAGSSVRLKEAGDVSQAGISPNYWEITKDDQEMQTRSFRHGCDDGLLHREMSPRILVRSLSAPVSGTSFGKLLLEDRHVLTGAQIRRKHEALGNVTIELKKRKKEKFNIKEKVSNFRYSLNFRGRLFGRKLQSMSESQGPEQDFVKDIMSGPTVIRNFGERHLMENSTEVPPSPASVCSSAQEDFWRQVDYSSPVSTSDVTPVDDSAMPQVFKDISSNLNELRRQLNQLESNEPDSSTVEQESDEYMAVELEDKAEAYMRDLLVASGLYDGSQSTILSRWDPLAKPINNSVFEKVEQSYRKSSKDDHQNGTKDHKLLYDLLNEALSTVLGPPVTMSRFRRKIVSFSKLPQLCGRKLLESVWDIIQADLYWTDDKSSYSLDTMVAKNLRSTPWSGLIDDEINASAKEMECRIIGDLIEEIMKDMNM